ncbi:hypothetical protein MMC19_007523 [Ptychographa xylographoides]|nr:hypothetical protein [Ptychographa xylographoides]
MAHPETLLPMSEIEDPVERFVSVVKFYLSGWHIKPPGVKKPLNPLLGETFTCYWDYPDHTRGYYISEQTSHHPPKSSYFYMAPEHNIRIDGTLKPRSKFLGNSAASMMEGIGILQFMNKGRSPRGERYILTQPNMYARGILFGKMKYELGDHSFVRCPENNLSADLEFKTKGYFSGTYNAIGGTIKNDKTGEILFELSGMWSGEMWIKNMKTGKKEVLFDATHAKHSPPLARPLDEQNDRESQKLWYKTCVALKEQNHEAATDEKTRIEDMQREEAAQRKEKGIEFRPKLFRPVRGGPGGPEEGEEDLDWILNAEINGATPEEKTKQILAVAPILNGQDTSKVTQVSSQKPQPPNPAQSPQQPQPAPPAQSTLPSRPVQPTQPDTISSQQPPAPKKQDDLIDFGDEPLRPPPPNTHFTEDTFSQVGLQDPLQTGHPIKRKDTNSEEVDEFVDADDGV